MVFGGIHVVGSRSIRVSQLNRISGAIGAGLRLEPDGNSQHGARAWIRMQAPWKESAL